VGEDVFLNYFFWVCFLGFVWRIFDMSSNCFWGIGIFCHKNWPFKKESHLPKKLINKIIMPNKLATNCLQHKEKGAKEEDF
jgi:hypothetical protein